MSRCRKIYVRKGINLLMVNLPKIWLIAPQYRVHPVVMGFFLQDPGRPIRKIHLVNPDVMIRRSRHVEHAPGRERGAEDLRWTRSDFFMVSWHKN